MRPLAAELLKERKSENSKGNPDAHCLPLGLMQLHMHPQPRKIIQNPGVIVILYEAHNLELTIASYAAFALIAASASLQMEVGVSQELALAGGL